MEVSIDLITSMIDNKIEECIKNNLKKENIERVLKAILDEMIKTQFKKESQNIINTKVNEYIEETLKGSIEVSDGWNAVQTYESFECFFKSEFKKKLDKDWEIKRIINNVVEAKLNELFKNKTKELTIKIQDMALNEMLKEAK